jgi:hypothetical protein
MVESIRPDNSYSQRPEFSAAERYAGEWVVVSELLGNSKISTTADVYTKGLDELKVDAADRMTRLLSR